MRDLRPLALATMSSVVAAAVLALVGLAAGPAAAEVTQPADEVTTPDPVIAAVRAELAERAAAATDEPQKSWLWELGGYYGAPVARPLWVSEKGFTPAGLAAVETLREAADWGLDPARFDIPEEPQETSAPAVLADTEIALSLAVTTYAWDARGGRMDPSKLSLWLDQSPRKLYASEVMWTLERAESVPDAMHGFHPRQPGFERLRQAYLKELAGEPAAALQKPPLPSDGPRLKPGSRHADVALIRDRLAIAAAPGDENLLDDDLMAAVQTFMRKEGYGRKRAIDNDVREALNRGPGSGAGSASKRKSLLDKYIVNLERWRWLPPDMGTFYVWNNLPEFKTRVVKHGEVVHEERIVIGKAGTQTPVFSDSMSHVIFNPEWGMPESIKIRQLLGRLKGGDYDVLRRRGLKIIADGKEISPSRFNWSKVNMREVPIVQGAGPGNPLGRLKFIFPNKHDVYMHDTPDKGLFEESVRTFSHGCIRVRNPARLAEVVLGEVEGWTADDVKAHLARTETEKIDLRPQVPVHNTYFTLAADASGAVSAFDDIYGHDRRILDALKGKPAEEIAAADPALALQRANQDLARQAAYVRPKPPEQTPAAYSGGFFWFGPPPGKASTPGVAQKYGSPWKPGAKPPPPAKAQAKKPSKPPKFFAFQ